VQPHAVRVNAGEPSSRPVSLKADQRRPPNLCEEFLVPMGLTQYRVANHRIAVTDAMSVSRSSCARALSARCCR